MDVLAPFERMLESVCSPADVRAIEGGGEPAALKAALIESGYLDALAPEAAGGAGLSLADAFPLLSALGRFAVPLPVGEWMIAKGLQPNNGLTTIADLPHSIDEKRRIGAVIAAAAIAGAGDRLLAMCVDYSNQRVQFGKPIARQQAVQQQLAVMAEQVVLARIAAQIGCSSGLIPTLFNAATAKHVASAAAVQIGAIAHAVHGAIGISEAYDLQLYTRRLHEWRMAHGSERYWAAQLGALRLSAPNTLTVDYVRAGGA
jgi:acyl-CoA dehydrogenase